MEIDNFEEFHVLQLQRILDAEQQLTKALPNMAAAAQAVELRQAFEHHRKQTELQAKRLRQMLVSMGESGQTEDCDITQALIDETDDLIAGIEASPLRDAALIGAGNKIEHCEIAAYEGAKLIAWKLGRTEGVAMLEQSLVEERAASERLIQLARIIL